MDASPLLADSCSVFLGSDAASFVSCFDFFAEYIIMMMIMMMTVTILVMVMVTDGQNYSCIIFFAIKADRFHDVRAYLFYCIYVNYKHTDIRRG